MSANWPMSVMHCQSVMTIFQATEASPIHSLCIMITPSQTIRLPGTTGSSEVASPSMKDHAAGNAERGVFDPSHLGNGDEQTAKLKRIKCHSWRRLRAVSSLGTAGRVNSHATGATLQSPMRSIDSSWLCHFTEILFVSLSLHYAH